MPVGVGGECSCWYPFVFGLKTVLLLLFQSGREGLLSRLESLLVRLLDDGQFRVLVAGR